jgi:hypothetical protein
MKERDFSVAENMDYVRRGRELRARENQLELRINQLTKPERVRFGIGSHPLNGERRDLAREIQEYERETKRRGK